MQPFRLLSSLLIVALSSGVLWAQSSPLTVEKIMKDPLESVGSLPSSIRWSEDSRYVYFMWNPDKKDADSLYRVPAGGGEPQKVSPAARKKLPAASGDYDSKFARKVYSKDGDLFLLTVKNMDIRRLTRTMDVEANPRFSADDKAIIFRKAKNLFRWGIADGSISQLTDFRSGKKKDEKEPAEGSNRRWLADEETHLIEVIRDQEIELLEARRRKEIDRGENPLPIYIGEERVSGQQLSPDGRFVTFRLEKDPPGKHGTEVPNYVTRDGYTTQLKARPKVGSPQSSHRFGIYDIRRDVVTYVDSEQIPGIFDQWNAAEGDSASEKKARQVITYGPWWSDNGEHAVVVIRAIDNKDRWIMQLDLRQASLKLLDRQHDEAWIGGPGISGWVFFPGNIGWLPDNRRIWFQSEESGFSHLYTYDVNTGKKKALTSGKYEVTDVQLSRDQKHWFLTTSEVHPGERHLYKMPVNGGKKTRISDKAGNHQTVISPNEKYLATRFSYSNQPWQLFVGRNKPAAEQKQVTDNLSAEFRAYSWRDPEIVKIPAEDGAEVYGRLYRSADAKPGDPAVIFVHGAGYLQNVHKWWSAYFREYMFHNLLVDNGYTVLDIDYRASAGYGRDWRTAIYRHMGGKDLTDQVDAAAWLVKELKIDPERIGIYGGSYGGFITFMAMFTQPDVFACGAALRPVTDWAHYNHPYTSNILNEPQSDSLAYVRSSPIYHAEGLKGALLICHGMIDTNVHFQDVVRLAQRLIELGKEDWELAVYPLEGHGFSEPSSWTDEYKRVFKLFETHLK